MKKNLKQTDYLFILILFCFCAGCNSKFRHLANNHQHGQIIVYYKNGTDSIRNLYKALLRQKYQFTYTTCVCDVNIELWTGSNIEELLQQPAIIKTETARTSSKTVVSGGDTIYLSLNLRYNRPEDSKGPSLIKMGNSAVAGGGKTNVRLAVLDTGLDTAYFEPTLYNRFLLNGNDVDVCPNEKHSTFAGWNIIDNNSNFYDNHPGKHGTTITGLALSESRIHSLKILPVKTHDKTGTGYYFHLLCGMKYAQQAKANLINASWGGLGEENAMFIHVLSQLRADSILFVTAAGNENRNLNTYEVYPARYSKADSGNVITITASKEFKHCRRSNYSAKYVDLGVSGRPRYCSFRSPFQPAESDAVQIRGTSFATAVFSGKLSDRYPYSRLGALTFKSSLFAGIPLSFPGVLDVRTGLRYKQQ